MDVMMHFGEKYGEEVRVVEVQGEPEVRLPVTRSAELCGGTHVSNTSLLYPFKIINQSSVAAGTRRIEAVVGSAARHWMQERVDAIDDIAFRLKTTPQPDAVKNAIEKLKELEQKQKADIKSLRKQLLSGAGDSSKDNRSGGSASAGNIVVHEIPDLTPDEPKESRKALQTFLTATAKADPERAHLVVCGPRLIACATQNKGLNAGDILKVALAKGSVMEGKGGGSPGFAQGQIAQDRNLSPEEILKIVQNK